MADEYEVKGTCPVCGREEKMRGNDPNGVIGMHTRYHFAWSQRPSKCKGIGQPAVAGSVDEFLASEAKDRARRAAAAEAALAEAQKKRNAAVVAEEEWQAFEAKARRKMAKAAK